MGENPWHKEMKTNVQFSKLVRADWFWTPGSMVRGHQVPLEFSDSISTILIAVNPQSQAILHIQSNNGRCLASIWPVRDAGQELLCSDGSRCCEHWAHLDDCISMWIPKHLWVWEVRADHPASQWAPVWVLLESAVSPLLCSPGSSTAIPSH